MSDIKKKLLAEIDKKAKKIAEKRDEAASNKTVEAYAFEFFRQIDEAVNFEGLRAFFASEALGSLTSKVRTVDPKANVEVLWLQGGEGRVQGVTIHWSNAYVKANGVDSRFYIDVGQILFDA